MTPIEEAYERMKRKSQTPIERTHATIKQETPIERAHKKIGKPRFKKQGLILNAWENLGDIASGFVQLPGAIKDFTLAPFEEKKRMAGAAGRAIVEDLSEWGDPAARLYNKPVSALLDVAIALDASAALIKIAKAPAAVAKAAEAIRVPALWKGLKKATYETIPEVHRKTWELSKAGEEIVNNRIVPNLDKRNPRLTLSSGEVKNGDDITKKLTPRERQLMTKALYLNEDVSAKVKPERRKLFDTAAAELREYVPLLEDFKLSGMTAEDAVKWAEIYDTSRWRGLALKEKKIGVGDELTPKTIEDLKAAGHTPPTYVPMTLNAVTKIDKTARRLGQVEEFSGDIGKSSDWMPPAKLGKVTPGSMKHNTGAIAQKVIDGEYAIDAQKAYASHAATWTKMQTTQGIIDDILGREGLPAGQGGTYSLGAASDWKHWDDLHEHLANLGATEGVRYKIFAPEGMIRYYQASMNMTDEVMKRLNGIVDLEDAKAIKDILDAAAPGDEAVKSWIAVSKNQKIYAIPEPIWKAVNKSVSPPSPGIKLFLDTPVELWKTLTLATPRRIMNDVFGTAVFNTLDKVGPSAYLKAAKKEFRAAVPEEIFQSGFAPTWREVHLGSAQGTLPGQAADFLRGAEIPEGLLTTSGKLEKALNIIPKTSQKLKQFGSWMNDIDGKMENFNRTANYISQVERSMPKGSSAADVLAEMKRAGGDVVRKKDLANQVFKFMYDFRKGSDFERRYVRRLFPFAAFYKHAVTLFLRLPVEYPGRAQVLKELSVIGEEMRRDKLAAMGIDPEMMPEYLKDAIPLGMTDEGNLNLMTTTGANPFSAIKHPLGLSSMAPPIKIAAEMMTGRDALTGRLFESPEFQEGLYGKLTDERGKAVPHYPIFGQTLPATSMHLARQLPWAGWAENLLYPVQKFPTSTFLNPQPRLDRSGQPIPIPRERILGQMVGFPTTEFDPARARMMDALNRRDALKRRARYRK